MERKPAHTSDFGVSRGEAHDASEFYNSRLYQDSGLGQPQPLEELHQGPVPPPGEWADRLYCHTAEDMHHLPDNSIALAVTSPPYNASKQYDEDLSLDDYLDLIAAAGAEVYRTLRPGGRFAVNIANLGRKLYIPLTAYFYQIHLDLGFLPMGEIIWFKGRVASGSTAWGSWQNTRSPRFRDVHEYILVFAKQSFSRPDRGESDITRDEFMAATTSVWEIAPESARRIGQPAPFPLALPDRLIRLLSFRGDVILDPFLGSGTTAVAARLAGRRYVGYDTNPEYIVLAEARLAAADPDQDPTSHP
jgi:site-specific DNA-methyltransferase (adenine-specific)